jgi:hypothetical protein
VYDLVHAYMRSDVLTFSEVELGTLSDMSLDKDVPQPPLVSRLVFQG